LAIPSSYEMRRSILNCHSRQGAGRAGIQSRNKHV
jgi:hypothetical protein